MPNPWTQTNLAEGIEHHTNGAEILFVTGPPIEPWKSVLVAKRERLRKSCADIAREIGQGRAMLHHVEGRVKPAPLALAISLCRYYACEIEDLFGSDGFALTLRDSEEYAEGQLELPC